ncbi:MAG: hypothetical protein CVU97_06645 [Firmicutes bacterium HGW-Firmicutes-21]|nr:MAG: hypothetical protein CVU97_06645 [Firmicutes bacterium HGW-Firmicutes-21]
MNLVIRKATLNDAIGVAVAHTESWRAAYKGMNGYAARACKLLIPVMRAHNMIKITITNEKSNDASMRVCEKIGADLLRVAELPKWTALYADGQRYVNIYEWSF